MGESIGIWLVGAIFVVITIITFAGVEGFTFANWWVGTPYLLLPVAVASFLILYRTQRLTIAAIFVALTTVGTVLYFLTVGETVLAFAGVEDPHLGYDDLPAVTGTADPTADLRLGVAHAPYLRVLDRFAADGYDAIVAGHTHGGQVRLPWPGESRALTTNCDLEPARARGLHRHPAASRPGDPGSAWLHVSAGLGANPYVRVRIACRPEATLLTLLPASPA